MSDQLNIGFLGAGSIAKSHVFSLDALKYYYQDSPQIQKQVVATPSLKSRTTFAEKFHFQEAIAPEEIFCRDDLDTLFILGPNEIHTPQLLRAAENLNLQRIYVEKPIGTTIDDIEALENLSSTPHNKFIVLGFQYLQKSAIRKALELFHTGDFGDPIHFRVEYLHSSYLDPQYRKAHPDRLKSIPHNGALADLGSHALSLLIAFLGHKLKIHNALMSGHFEDVPSNSDLCTTVLLEDTRTGAAGTLTASRVSAGTGDHLYLEIRAKSGALIFNSSQPDTLNYYRSGNGWQQLNVMSDYQPHSKFPTDYVPSGWLRALIHNHYLFLGGNPNGSFIPDLNHGIEVQKLIQKIANHISNH